MDKNTSLLPETLLLSINSTLTGENGLKNNGDQITILFAKKLLFGQKQLDLEENIEETA
jgi:hypothetical protein